MNALMTATSHTLEADDYVSFGSLSPHLPGMLRERKVARYEASLLAFLGDETQLPGRLSVYREAHEQLQTHLAGSLKATDALVAGPRVLTADFWTRLDAEGLSLLQRLSASRSGALLAEAQLQVHEGRLSAQSYELLKEVVSEPWSALRGDSTVRVCDVSLGNTQRSYLLLGAMVMTRQAALDDHQADELVYLFVPGLAGGLHAFGSVARLKAALARSVRADPDGFWLGHVSLKSRAGARAAISAEADDNPVILRVLDGHAFNLGVEDQIASYQEITALMAGGQWLYDQSTPEQSLERLRLETAHNLMAPDNEARGQAIDQVAEQLRTARATRQLPDWLLQLPAEARNGYARGLMTYARNAAWLEQDLAHSLPSFEVFTRDTLADRLKADLKRTINPDAVKVDMPDSVTVEVVQTGDRPERPHLAGDISESIAITDFSTRDDVSLSRHTISLSALARHNIDVEDEQQMLRLKHSHFTLDGLDTQALGIDLEYLLKTLPELDVATHYNVRITDAFLGRTPAGSQPGAPDIARRLAVFRQAINLEAWAARQQGHLSEAGLRLLQAATSASNGKQPTSGEFDIEYRYTLLRSPIRGDGSYTEQGLTGLSVVHDKTSELSLMYLPGAPGNQKFVEDISLQGLRSRLANLVLLDRSLLDYLARSASAGSDPARNVQNINAILRSADHGFLLIDPVRAPHLTLTDMQYMARMGKLREQVDIASRTALEIQRRQLERSAERELGYVKLGLSVLPGIGTAIAAYDGWHDANAAVNAFARGDYKAGASLLFSATLNLGEVILTLAPLVVKPGAAGTVLGHVEQVLGQAGSTLYDVGRRASKALQKKRLGNWLPSINTGKSWQSKAFEGYEVNVRLYDAVRLTGKNENVFLLNQRMYIQVNDKVYEVYRRAGEQTLRLKARPPKNYEPPVRQNARGEWEYHLDVGGKGGSPFPELDEVIVDSTPVTSTRKVPAGYDVPPQIAPAPLPAVRPQGIESMDRVVIGQRDLFISRELDEVGGYGVFRIDPADPTRLQAQGTLTAEGVYRLVDQPGSAVGGIFEEVAEDFVLMDNKFYRVRLDTDQLSWKVVGKAGDGRSALFIEADGVFDPVTQRVVIGNWHLTPQLGNHPRLETLVRQAFDLPASGHEYEVHTFLRNYTRQIVKSVDPHVMRAPDVLELERLCEQSLHRQQFPIGRLDEALTSMANKQPLPIWAPVYDELQGLRTVLPTPSGRIYNMEVARQLNKHMLIRTMDVEVMALLDSYAALRSGVIATHAMRTTLSKKILQLVMRNRGYTRLEGGRYRRGSIGFGMVFRGPNGDVYLMEIRHLQPTGSSWGKITFERSSSGSSIMMSDDWVEIVAQRSITEVPFNPAAVAVLQAKADGRLFKLIGTITPDRGVMVFKIAGPAGVPSPVAQAL